MRPCLTWLVVILFFWEFCGRKFEAVSILLGVCQSAVARLRLQFLQLVDHPLVLAKLILIEVQELILTQRALFFGPGFQPQWFVGEPIFSAL